MTDPLATTHSLNLVQDLLTCSLLDSDRLESVISGIEHVCQAQYASTENFTLLDLQWQEALQIEHKQPNSLYIIYIIFGGLIDQQFNRPQSLCCSIDIATIVTPGQELRGRTSKQGHVLLIGIKQSAIAHVLTKLLDQSVKQPVIFEPTINLTDEVGSSLKQFAQFMWQGLSDAAVRSPLVLKELEQAFLDCLVQRTTHNYSKALVYQRASDLVGYVQKAQTFIEAHLQADIQLRDVAAAVGVSTRTLEKAFAQHCGCSPMRFLKQTRLRRIREDLCDAPPGTKVAEVMARYGLVQGGKFASAYREMYGELPSETLKRHRKI